MEYIAQRLIIFLDYERRRRSADTEQTMHLRAGDDAMSQLQVRILCFESDIHAKRSLSDR